jgi:hypothetical protein
LLNSLNWVHFSFCFLSNTCPFGTAQSNGTFYFAVFSLLVSLYWGGQVFKNIVHVTVAGTFATWYFLPAHQMPASPTAGALKRACTTSFGSICLGSLLVAVVQALKQLVHQVRLGALSLGRERCY